MTQEQVNPAADDEALAALAAEDRSEEIDASYSAYDQQPIGEMDAWGDLASFHEAADKA